MSYQPDDLGLILFSRKEKCRILRTELIHCHPARARRVVTSHTEGETRMNADER
jgi:hypothetical protein